MNMTGIVYRPPYEANSLLLQVTLGCSHNKCTFCYMYPDVQFKVCPMEEVEADIEEATHYCPNVKRVFLEHGDAFVLSAEKLLKIADAIHRKLPRVETIAMYASIQNIKSKTDEELRQLRTAGIHGLDIGVESGLDAALTYMNKGHTAAEVREQLLRLTEAGMDYSFNAILGCGGAELWKENADATADLINAVQPHLLFIGREVEAYAKILAWFRLGKVNCLNWHIRTVIKNHAKAPPFLRQYIARSSTTSSNDWVCSTL